MGKMAEYLEKVGDTQLLAVIDATSEDPQEISWMSTLLEYIFSF